MSWPLVALGEVSTLQAGVGFPSRLQGRVDGELPFAKVGDISSLARAGGHTLASARNHVTREDAKALGVRPIPAGSTLFAKIGEAISQNFRVLAGTDVLIDNNAMAAIPHEIIDARYLYRFLQTVDMYKLVSSTTVPALRKSDLQRLEVPLPPLPEQRRIASILDQADLVRRALSESVELANSLEGSLLRLAIEEANGQLETVALADLVAEGDRINYGVVQPGAPVSDGVALIRAGDLGDGQVDRSHLRFISPSIERAYTRSRIRGNEILVSCVGSIGEVAIVSSQDIGSNIARAVARVPLSQTVNRDYVFAILRSPSTQEYFTREQRTVAQPTLNIKQLTETPIDLPGQEVQARFGGRIAALRGLSALHLTRLAAIEELFASLQNGAFSGAL